MAPDPVDDRDVTRDEEPPPDLPTSLVPRWLALVVLLALIASAVVSTWLVLDSGPRPAPPPAASAP